MGARLCLVAAGLSLAGCWGGPFDCEGAGDTARLESGTYTRDSIVEPREMELDREEGVLVFRYTREGREVVERWRITSVDESY